MGKKSDIKRQFLGLFGFDGQRAQCFDALDLRVYTRFDDNTSFLKVCFSVNALSVMRIQ